MKRASRPRVLVLARRDEGWRPAWGLAAGLATAAAVTLLTLLLG